MITTPAIKAQYRVEHRPDEGIFLLSEYGHHILTGKANELVIPLIDGQSSFQQIADQLDGQLNREEVYYTLMRLEKDGHLIEANNGHPKGETAFWNFWGQSTSQIDTVLQSTPIGLIDVDGKDTKAMHQLLSDAGFVISEAAAITLVFTSDYLHPALLSFNEQAVAAKKKWIPIKAAGGVSWMGPIMDGSQTPCAACLANRLRANRKIEQYLYKKGQATPILTSRIETQATLHTALNMVLTQLGRLVATGHNPLLENHLITFDQLSMQSTFHPVVKRPQCEVCGDVTAFRQMMSGPVQLDSSQKTEVWDGGNRNTTPAVTYEKFKHHISPVTGVVEYLRPAFHSNQQDMYSYVAGNNFALESFQSAHKLRQNIRSMSGGKGNSEAQARTSALCEALERYSGLYQGEEPIRSAVSFREISDDAIHPNRCMQFSEQQYQQRDWWLQKGSHFNYVPIPFQEDEKIDWAPVWSMTEQRSKYLPASYLYYNYPQPPERSFCFGDSNGCAAGNNKEEAILQGFFELIERDAVAIWWYNRLQRPLVELSSFQLPMVATLNERYAQIGREFWVLDLSFDFPIPVFAAITRSVQAPTEEIIFGFGAHFDARIALSRALAEMNQFLPWVDQFRNAGISYDLQTTQWLRHATLANQPYLRPLNMAPISSWQYPNHAHPTDLREDVLLCQQLVESKGMEMLIQNQTRPDIGLSVVKVIVPGLRHFWARYAPGRLYDVPVQLGLLPRALQETELNPMLMFI
ncbi:MAG: TOMM precursor leader peptide-binding protein [Bacteroidota bacterium]